MQKALVSVIVPVYQSASVLSETIEALLAQTYRPLEIILVDDGATDGSSKICDLYAERYDEVMSFHQKHAGVSVARNYGIKVANGHYIQFTDADDKPLPNLIDMLVVTLEKNHADMAVCGYEVISEKKRNTERFRGTVYSKTDAEDVYTVLMQNMLSVTWNKLYVKSKIKHLYDVSLSLCEDSIFCTAYFMDNNTMAVCPDVLYQYYVNNGNPKKRIERISGYNGIKKYFAHNRRLAKVCSDKKQSENVMQHICKVFYYGVYTYIFEVVAQTEAFTPACKEIFHSVLKDTLYQKVIRRIKDANMKERIYRLLSVMQTPFLLWCVLKVRQGIIKWRS